MRIRPYRLVNHAFVRALRVAGEHLPLFEYLSLLVGEQKKLLRQALSSLFLATVIVIALSNGNAEGEALDIRLPSFVVSIPFIYAVFAAALSTFGSAVAMIIYLVVGEMVRVGTSRLDPSVNPQALFSHIEASNSSSLGLLQHNRFSPLACIHCLGPPCSFYI
jgi:hypothetical protein